MISRLLFALALVAGACLSLTPAADAQYYPSGCSSGYCPPTNQHFGRSYGYAPSYSHTGYRNVLSGWAYTCWSGDHSLYTRHRTWYDHCGTATNHYDRDWLYSRYWHGGQWCYRQHCRLDAYGSYKPVLEPSPYFQQRGATEVGYYAPELELVTRYPLLMKPGMLQQADVPRAIDPSNFISADTPDQAARDVHAVRISQSANDVAQKILSKGQEIEQERVRGRNALSLQVQADNSKERLLIKLTEALAVLDKTAVIDADAGRARGDHVAFDGSLVKAELAELLNGRCVSCHGAAKQEGKLDLRDYAAFDAKRWRSIRSKCESGEMPKDGQPLTDAELDLLDGQVTAVRSKG